MKNCTHCGKAYSDWVDFCFDDGTVLVQEQGGSVTVEFDLEETDAPLPGNLIFGGSADVRAVQAKEEPAVLAFTPVPKAPVPKELKGYSTPKPEEDPKPEPKTPEPEGPKPAHAPPPKAEPFSMPASDVSPIEVDEPQEHRPKRTVVIFVAAAASSFVLLAALGGTALFASAGFYAKQKDERKELALLEEAKVADVVPEVPEVSAPEPAETPADTDTELLDTDDVVADAAVPDADVVNVPVEPNSIVDKPALAAPPKVSSAQPVQRRPMAPREVTGNPVTPKSRAQSNGEPVVTRPPAKPPVAKVTANDAPASVVNKPVTAEVATPEPPEAPKRMVNVLVLLPGADGQPVNLTVDGTRMGEGKLWPVRLQLSEGPHRIVVEHKGEKTERSKMVEYKESMVIMTLN